MYKNECVIYTRSPVRRSLDKPLDDYIGFLEDNEAYLARLDFVMRPQFCFVLDPAGKQLVDRLFRLETDLDDLNKLLHSSGKRNIPTLNTTPAMDIKCRQRQIDRLAAIYAADRRLYESVSNQTPSLRATG
ncbi:MAG TPA: hypothetical protein VEK34_08480 [Methylocella sp.]|nr:hypothetical protein [Methylocella sp.]